MLVTITASFSHCGHVSDSIYYMHAPVATIIITDIENQDPLSRGSSCSTGKFHLVRIGKPERIHSELSYLSLDYQAKKLLAKSE